MGLGKELVMKKLLKKFSAGLLAAILTAGMSTASAENAGAAKAKTLLTSRTFYLEYGNDLKGTKLLKHKADDKNGIAISGGKKMLYRFSLYNLKLAPAWYTDGASYFRILNPKEVVYFTQEQIEDPYINPSDGEVNFIAKMFERPVPDEFSMFDPNAEKPFTYVDSGTCAVDNKNGTASYDRYSRPAKNALGQDVKTEYAYVYYDAKNTLLGVDMLVVAPDEDANAALKKIVQQKTLDSPVSSKYVFRRKVVIKLDSVLPKDFAKFNPKTKYVQPWVGDMNELIEERVPADNFVMKE